MGFANALWFRTRNPHYRLLTSWGGSSLPPPHKRFRDRVVDRRLTRVLRRFDYIPNCRQKLICNRAINDPMVKAETEDSHLTNCNRIVYDDGPFLDNSDTQYRHLRLVDNWSSCPSSENSGIGDREGPALHFIGLELLFARALSEIIHRVSQPKKRLLIGPTDYRHDQSPIERDCHAYIDVFLVNDLIAPHRGIDYRPLSDAFDNRFDDKRHKR